MKRIGSVVVVLFLLANAGLSAPMATATRSVIPKDVQQIITLDYRDLKASPVALALKERVLPPKLKQFEMSLRDLGIDLDKDVETLTFVSFRTPKQDLQVIGIAQGTFEVKAIRKRLRLDEVRPFKYHEALLYPLGQIRMTFLDDFTLLFGEAHAIHSALDARDGYAETVTSNSAIADLIAAADNGPVWSVMDALGTQTIVKSALGDVSQIGDFGQVKKCLLGARYSMNFTNSFRFDLDIVTSDTLTAAMMSSLINTGMMFRRYMTNNPADKVALDSVRVESESGHLRVHFKTDDKTFPTLLQSDLFASMSQN